MGSKIFVYRKLGSEDRGKNWVENVGRVWGYRVCDGLGNFMWFLFV